MRNLEVINCVALPADSIVARARCFCLDCDRGVVWVATDNVLCSIEDNKVGYFNFALSKVTQRHIMYM